MSNKETVIKKILKLVAKLHNECKVPSVFGVNSTNGVISYGSKEVVSKGPVLFGSAGRNMSGNKIFNI